MTMITSMKKIMVKIMAKIMVMNRIIALKKIVVMENLRMKQMTAVTMVSPSQARLSRATP